MAPPEQNPFFRPVQQAIMVIALTIVLAALAIGAYLARWILLATIIGLGVGILLGPMMRLLKERLHIPHGVGALLFFVLFMTSTAGILYSFYFLFSKEVVPLLSRAPEIVESARVRLSELFRDYPWMQRYFQTPNLGAAIQDATQTLIGGVQLGATAIGGLFYILAVGIYYAISPQEYLRGLLSLFPQHMRASVADVLAEAGKTLRRWFAAQLIAMGSVGAIVAVGLWIIGVPYWPAFGLLTALLDIVPYIGPLLAAGASVTVTLASDPERALWVILCFVVANQLESNVVIPLIMRGRVSLPPIHVLTLMLILGSWFGILGVLVAPPLLAVGRTVYLLTYVPRMNRRTRRGPPEAGAKPGYKESA